ncbi:MAG: hypothetical protein ABSE79_01770 [Terriglobia bacterium]
MIRRKSDSSFHGACPAYPDFPGFTPQTGICGINLRAQVVSLVMFSPSNIPGLPRKCRRAAFLKSGAKMPQQVR